MYKCASFVLLYLVHVDLTVTFNLEFRIPVIKYGAQGSYFGYSVAEHQIDKDTDRQRNVLLVGAPLGSNLQPETNHSGALWKCDISMNPRDCEQVITDGRQVDEDHGQLNPPAPDETKNGQWMGSIVRSQGGLVLVCAHRYMKNYWGNGLCLVLTNNLSPENGEFLSPCEGRSTNRAHEEFGYCQVGTSGILLDDGFTLVLGSPGPYTWRGTIFVIDMQENIMVRDLSVYQSPLNDTSKPVDKYSYLGMSVAAGNFYNNKKAFAAGSPRSNNTGQVLIFTKPERGSLLNHVLTLNGEQFASSFGYEMASADINGDKLQDLIIGAPFYFQKHEGGAVYVYLNSPDELILKSSPQLKLTGKPESRFGFSIASLGDLNKDGFDDIAIGAPYEGNGVIYIYLGSKKGLLEDYSQRISAEDIPSEDGRTLRTFGYSLSGGVDMDNNSYPDLLVGAYEADTIVLLRARQIINITTTIKRTSNLNNIDASIKGCESNRSSENTCFSFEACCQIMSLANSTRSSILKLNYHIEAETFPGNNRKFSRVWFGRQPLEHIVKGSINIANIYKEYCEIYTVYIKNNTKDILSPIKFLLNYTLEQTEPHFDFNIPLPHIDNYPILNKQRAEKIFEATFQKDCGLNDVCESDIIVEATLPLEGENDMYNLILGLEDELKMSINVSNSREPAYEAQLFIKHHIGLSYIGSVKDKQTLCNRYNESLVICTLGNPFKKGYDANVQLRFDPKTLDDAIKDFEFVIFVNSTSKEINPKAPKKIRVDIVKKAEVSIKGLASRTNIIYGGEVKGESAVKYGEDIGSNVTHSYYVVNNGPWKIPRLSIEVSWPFQVANNKPQGKWLLYLETLPVIDAPNGGICIMSKGQVNPLNLTARNDLELHTENPKKIHLSAKDEHSPSNNRVKRDTEVIIRSTFIKDSSGHEKEVVTMDCEKNTAKCIKFNCIVYNLPRSGLAVLNIRARLWNSTLVEDYPKVDWVEIVSQARIYIPPEYSIQQNTSDDRATVETLAYPDLLNQQATEPISLWIIIIAIVTGLLVLVLLTLLLWKLGFFKRRRPEAMMTGSLEKHREDSPFLGRQDQ